MAAKKQKKKWSSCTLREIDPEVWRRFKAKSARLDISMKQRLMNYIYKDVQGEP